MHWHSMWKVPVRHIFVEEQALRNKGYTLETDMQLVATIQAPCKANEYAMRLPEVSSSTTAVVHHASMTTVAIVFSMFRCGQHPVLTLQLSEMLASLAIALIYMTDLTFTLLIACVCQSVTMACAHNSLPFISTTREYARSFCKMS